jgi:uncharacterized protein
VSSEFRISQLCNILNARPQSYALSELQKDVEQDLEALPEPQREAARTKFAIFVVHNKLKPKLAEIPPDVP